MNVKFCEQSDGPCDSCVVSVLRPLPETSAALGTVTADTKTRGREGRWARRRGQGREASAGRRLPFPLRTESCMSTHADRGSRSRLKPTCQLPRSLLTTVEGKSNDDSAPVLDLFMSDYKQVVGRAGGGTCVLQTQQGESVLILSPRVVLSGGRQRDQVGPGQCAGGHSVDYNL